MAKNPGDGGVSDEQGMAEVAQSLGAQELVVSEDAAQMAAWSAMVPQASDEQLRNVSSYDEALALAEEMNAAVFDISEELGTGFVLLEDKSKLKGVEFVALLWRINPGTFGGFASMAVVTRGGEKYIVNDGSTGIYDQLRTLSSTKKVFGGMKVPRGLRDSQYATCMECGKPRTSDEVECSVCHDTTERRAQGVTYYLDTTPLSN